MAVTGTHETYWWEAAQPLPRTLALPPGWTTGKVLIDGPSSGNRPSLESRISDLLCSHPPHTGNGRPLPAGRAEKCPLRVFGPCAMPALDPCKNRARAPRVSVRPPSADRPGIAESGVGRTVQALRPF